MSEQWKPGKPSFILIPVVTTPSINPGEYIEIEYYFTGSGFPFNHPPDHAKLYVNFSGIDPESDIEVMSAISGGIHPEDESKHVVHTGEKGLEKFSMSADSPSFTYGLGKHYFAPRSAEVGDSSENMPPLLGESKHGGYPPLTVMFKASTDQPPGDYEIRSVLTYEQDDIIDSDESLSTVHVTNWVQRRGKLLKIAGLLIASFGLILAFVSLGIDIWEFFA